MLERVWRKGPLLHSWWECKLVRSLWRTVWTVHKKLGTELLYDLEIPLFNLYTEETKIERDMSPYIFNHWISFHCMNVSWCVYRFICWKTWGFPNVSDSKESTSNAGDPGSSPGLGRSPGERRGNSLQYPCLKNPMDRGSQGTIVHVVAQSQTQLKWT